MPAEPAAQPSGEPRGLSTGVIALGAAVALSVAVPVIVAVQVIDAIVGIDEGSAWGGIAFLAIVLGLATGGFRAGRRRPDAPLAHASLAAVGAYAVIAAVAVARFTAQGTALPVLALVANLFLASSAGIVGGMLAARRNRTETGDPSG